MITLRQSLIVLAHAIGSVVKISKSLPCAVKSGVLRIGLNVESHNNIPVRYFATALVPWKSPVKPHIHWKFSILTMALLSLPSVCCAQAIWDVRGYWDICYFVQDGRGDVAMQITNEVYNTGSFTASNYAGNGIEISGQVEGSSIQFTAGYSWGYIDFVGTVAADGTISGDLGEWNGSWWGGEFETCAGRAELFSGPMFTIEPVSQVISAGQSVTFSASAAGYPAPTFQWQFDGVDISNATNSSYSLSSTTITNLGLYNVLASNCVATNVSTMASLSFLDVKCFPGLVLYGPSGMAYNVQVASTLSGGANWTTVTNVTLTSVQPYIYIDYSSITNGLMFYRAVPQ
jgi:hypothetical protein